jgi:myo-inositol-1(or 4)-monophosphatase
MSTSFSTPDRASVEADAALLPDVVAAVEAAGAHLLSRFRAETNLMTFDEITTTIHAGDGESLGVLRPLLERARPGTGWVEDELDDGALPAGDWWVVDPIEGAINYVHGMSDWAVTATLVRDNLPVLTVVHLPMAATTYTAVRGHGAQQDGVRLQVSAKTELSAALVGTGQASPRETSETFALIGKSVQAMLEAAGVVRVSVPATLQLIHVAAGRMDAFWQHSAVRSGLLAGALLVAEAGGTITDLQGRPWSLASDDFLAAAPGLRAAAISALA